VAADPGSCVFAGLHPEVDAAALRNAIEKGTVEQCLNRVFVAAGDCLLIPAGTVHAIGEGIVLAEVQQASNVTFRLFDWNRLDAQGAPRELHVEQSLECIDFSRGLVHKVTPSGLRGNEDRSQALVDCPYFTIHRHLISHPMTVPNDDRCHILMALEGQVGARSRQGSQLLAKGETVLLPAASLPVELVPSTPAVLLEIVFPGKVV